MTSISLYDHTYMAPLQAHVKPSIKEASQLNRSASFARNLSTFWFLRSLRLIESSSRSQCQCTFRARSHNRMRCTSTHAFRSGLSDYRPRAPLCEQTHKRTYTHTQTVMHTYTHLRAYSHTDTLVYGNPRLCSKWCDRTHTHMTSASERC